jgi:hypothetical protein
MDSVSEMPPLREGATTIRGLRSAIDEHRLRIDDPKVMRVVRSVTVLGAAVLLVLGCGGRYSTDNDLAAGAGRASMLLPEGGAPINVAGAPSGGASSGGAPSGGAPSGGAPSGGAPSAGAPSGCQSENAAPNGAPVNPAPQNVSGEYQLVTCGQATQCTMPGAPLMPRALDDRIELSVSQNPDDLSHGTVTLNGTGELLLDGRAFDAKFTGRSFGVALSGPINAVCNQEYDLSFSYDFDGHGPRKLNLDFERSPNCSGNNGSEYCKGNVHGTFGDAASVLE